MAAAGNDYIWRGDWDGGATYLLNTIVRHSNSIWLCLTQLLTVSEPGVGTDWALILGDGGGGVGPTGPQGPVGPAGPTGPQGVKGDGGNNAYAATTNAPTQPAIGSDVVFMVGVGGASWPAIGQIFYVAGGGYYTCEGSNESSHSITGRNLGYPGNVDPGTVIASNARVTPGGLQGLAGTSGSAVPVIVANAAALPSSPANGTIALTRDFGALWIYESSQWTILSGGIDSSGAAGVVSYTAPDGVVLTLVSNQPASTFNVTPPTAARYKRKTFTVDKLNGLGSVTFGAVTIGIGSTGRIVGYSDGSTWTPVLG